MNTEEYLEEMNEIFSSREFSVLDRMKKRDYRSWLAETRKHPDRYQHVIHKIKYKLGILRTQKEKLEEE